MTERGQGLVTTRRRPWLAGLLGLVWPGIGHLYAGRSYVGCLLLVAFPLVELAILLLAVLVRLPVVNIAIPVALLVSLRTIAAVTAARHAARFAVTSTLPVYSRWYACLGAIAIAAGLNTVWGHAYRTSLVEAYKVPTGSMRPTIVPGDRLLAIKWAYGWRDPARGNIIGDPRPPKRGELAVFRYPEDLSRVFIMRVIGLPGETIELRQKEVLVDHAPLHEPYAEYVDLSDRDDWGPTVVPDGGYFVLGDYRDNARDSRYWGFVPQGNLVGRAAVLYWSHDPADGVRWGRIGRRPE